MCSIDWWIRTVGRHKFQTRDIKVIYNSVRFVQLPFHRIHSEKRREKKFGKIAFYSVIKCCSSQSEIQFRNLFEFPLFGRWLFFALSLSLFLRCPLIFTSEKRRRRSRAGILVADIRSFVYKVNHCKRTDEQLTPTCKINVILLKNERTGGRSHTHTQSLVPFSLCINNKCGSFYKCSNNSRTSLSISVKLQNAGKRLSDVIKNSK